MSYTRIALDNWLKAVDVNAERVLDVGGSRFPIEGRTKSWNVKEYKILDLEVPHECRQTPDIVMDLNEEQDWFGVITDKSVIDSFQKFDVVFCIEISEYLWNPVQALQNICTLLKQNGILYLSTHFVYPVHDPSEDDYLRYTRAGIAKLLEKTGFKIEEIKMRPALSREMIDFYGEQRMRASKHYKFHSEVGHLIKARKL